MGSKKERKSINFQTLKKTKDCKGNFQKSGNGNGIRRMCGTVYHPNTYLTDENQRDPLSGQHCIIYTLGKIFFVFPQKKKVGEFYTNEHGRYEVELTDEVTSEDFLLLTVLEERLPKKYVPQEKGPLITFEKPFKLPTIPQEEYNFFNVLHYEYQDDLPILCRHGVSENGRIMCSHVDSQYVVEKSPQKWDTVDRLRLLRSSFDGKVKDIILSTLPDEIKCVEGIEKLYGVEDNELADSVNHMEKNTIELLLNGLFPYPFLKGTNESQYVVRVNFKKYELDNSLDGKRIANIELEMEKIKDDLRINRVCYQLNSRSCWETFYPRDGEKYKKALFLANSMFILKGEIVSHLGIGHLYTEQNTMAVFRTINKNPIGRLLKPHLREVTEIDDLGTELIFGENGILHVSALSTTGIRDMLKDVLGSICYSNFKPRNPVSENHRFAKAENIFWDIVSDVVETFFKENEESIKNNWIEVFYLSKSLVENCVRYRPAEGEYFSSWKDTNEIDDPNFEPRYALNKQGELASVRPITQKISEPEEGDMVRLKQYSKYAIFCATFWHWAVHRTQGKWGTNLQFASLAPRGDMSNKYGNTAPTDAARQLSIAHMLMDFRGGELVENPNGDVLPYFIRKIIERKSDFDDLGYDIKDLFYGVFI